MEPQKVSTAVNKNAFCIDENKYGNIAKNREIPLYSLHRTTNHDPWLVAYVRGYVRREMEAIGGKIIL